MMDVVNGGSAFSIIGTLTLFLQGVLPKPPEFEAAISTIFVVLLIHLDENDENCTVRRDLS